MAADRRRTANRERCWTWASGKERAVSVDKVLLRAIVRRYLADIALSLAVMALTPVYISAEGALVS